MNTTVLVTEPEFLKAEDFFRGERELCCEPAPPDEMALAQAVDRRRECAVVAGAGLYRGPLYEALGRQGAAIIARFGVSHDGIDKPLARRHGIVATNTPGALYDVLAERRLGGAALDVFEHEPYRPVAPDRWTFSCVQRPAVA